MKKYFFFIFSFLLFSIIGKCQPYEITKTNKKLFDEDQILNITLKGKIHKLLNDREGEAKYYPLTLLYEGNDSEISIHTKVKTRGHFRRDKANCGYPPLLINFSDTASKSISFFPTHSSLKLVMPCKGDQFVVHEWLVYKLYNLVTEQSFRARLVKVTFIDDDHKKMVAPFYGMLLEDEKQMAKRNNSTSVKKKMKPYETNQESFLKMAVFEYMIGNTDWSVEYLQNIKLITLDSVFAPVAVPYDFDLSGIVDAPYALPAPELKMASVRERRYRGYCVSNMNLFDSTIAFYNGIRKKVYSLYADCSLLDDRYKKQTLNYLDQFYSIINNPKTLKKEFGYPCLENGTGNVIIKGLREN